MRRSKLCLAPFLATAALLACSSDGSSGGGGPSNDDGGAPAPVTPQAACEHDFRVRLERCNKDLVASETMTSARTRYVASCVDALSLPGSTRTADEVEACAKAVEAEECGVFPELLPACAPKAGTLPTGSACNVGGQCQSGHCDLESALAKGKGCGVCTETTPEGEGCDPERSACAVGTFCIGSPESRTSTTCKRVGYVDANAACNGFDLQCRAGLICVSVDGQAATCQPPFAAGKPCDADAACGMDAFCSRQTGQCTNLVAEGGACDAQNPCARGLGCDRTTNKCAPLTFAEPGESCGGSVACREGVCGQGTGAPTCPPVVEDGKGCLEGAHMTCAAPAACIAGACVMPTTATCQ